MNAQERKALLAELAAAVIRGLPAPTSISIHDNGEAYLTLEYCADVAAWTDPATVFEHLYEPEEQHPTGHRITGGRKEMFGTTVHVTANEELPAPGGNPGSAAEQTVLGFVEGSAEVAESTVDGVVSPERLDQILDETIGEEDPACDECEDCADFDVEQAYYEALDEIAEQATDEERADYATECFRQMLEPGTTEDFARWLLARMPVRLPLDEAWEAAHDEDLRRFGSECQHCGAAIVVRGLMWTHEGGVRCADGCGHATPVDRTPVASTSDSASPQGVCQCSTFPMADGQDDCPNHVDGAVAV